MGTSTISQETEILSRVIAPDNPNLSSEAARSILALRFSDADNEQMNSLAAKARLGNLGVQEESMLNAHLLVGSLVDLMHSKARLSLAKNPA
jgi:hypothetical protein